MDYEVDQNIGPETLTEEYKCFYLYDISRQFSEEELEQFIYSKNFNKFDQFNDMVCNLLREHIDKYVPKYLGNFSKAHLTGSLYFGVDDFGTIEGIPLFGEFDLTKIKLLINATAKNVRGPNVKWYYDNLKINIHKLNICNLDNTETLSNIDLVINQNIELSERYKQYIDQYNHWHSRLTYYSCKLINYFIDPVLRNGLIEYAHQNAPVDKLQYLTDYYNSDAYKLEQFDMDNIENISKNTNHPIFWLLKYKDSMLQTIKQQKPKKLIEKPCKDILGKYCTSMHNLAPLLINLSQPVNFFLIEIIIPKRDNDFLEYRLTDTSEWLSKERKNISSGPYCE